MSEPRIIKFSDLAPRRIPKREWKADRYYYEQLDTLIDRLFEIADTKQLTWAALAAKAGLAQQTVENLGERITKRPQFRTVLLIAAAINRSITLKITKGRLRSKLRIAS